LLQPQLEGFVEIVGDALNWDWPLLLEPLAPSGLPENVVGCREVDLAAHVGDADPEAPHHALLDARLICRVASKVKDS